MTARRTGFPLLGVWLVTATVGWAADPYQSVFGTPHDFLARGDLPSGQRVCGSCHTTNDVSRPDIPGAGLVGDGLPPPTPPSPLWQPSAPPFTVGPPDQIGASQAAGRSGRCLECHDGVLGREVHQIGRGGSRVFDHPYNIRYPRDADGRFTPKRPTVNQYRYWSIPDLRDGRVIAPTGPVSTRLALTGADPAAGMRTLVRTSNGMLHCDSCHDPHDNRNAPFLRAPAHDLCLICHDR